MIVLLIGLMMPGLGACQMFATGPATTEPTPKPTPKATATPASTPTPAPTLEPTPEPTPEPRVIDPSLPMVALTFDDGPGEFTNQVLDILEVYNVVATFFVMGRKLEDNSDTILRAYEMGCEIGNHSWSHPSLDRISSSRIQTQLLDTGNAVESITGVAPAIMRPTFGRTNKKVINASRELELAIILWSIDPSDYLDKSPESIYDHIMDNVEDKDIILLHDIHERSIEATIFLIPSLINRGFQLVTVSELMDFSGITLEPGEKYWHAKS